MLIVLTEPSLLRGELGAVPGVPVSVNGYERNGVTPQSSSATSAWASCMLLALELDASAVFCGQSSGSSPGLGHDANGPLRWSRGSAAGRC